MKALVSIIAPVYNEEPAIAEFVRRVDSVMSGLGGRYDHEIVLVDDGSKDRSLEIMKGLAASFPSLRVIELRRNYGQTPALQAGLDAAKGDVFITMDSDLQHFPEEIPEFLAKLDEGYDMVCGWRHQRKEGIIRRWPSRTANILIRMTSGLPLHDFGTTFRAYRAEVARELRLYGEAHRYIPVLGSFMGARITEIPIKNIERPKGKSNYGLGRTFGVFLDILLLYFLVRYLDRPLRIFGKIGMCMMGLGGLIFAVLVIYGYSQGQHTVKDHIGWFLTSVMLLIAGVQTMIAGILGEILTRIHYTVGDRKVYRIRKEWSASSGA